MESEPVNFQVTLTFVERGERTEVTIQMLFPSMAARDNVVTKYGADEGAGQTLERLCDHLAAMIAMQNGRNA
jgi:hypothetical protein